MSSSPAYCSVTFTRAPEFITVEAGIWPAPAPGNQVFDMTTVFASLYNTLNDDEPSAFQPRVAGRSGTLTEPPDSGTVAGVELSCHASP